MDFVAPTTCRDCTLSSSAIHPGIPTRPLHEPGSISNTTALLFVGEAPGLHEDRRNRSWVGAAGQLLERFISSCQFSSADIYLSNSCRCRPDLNTTPSVGQINACRKHLQRDLDALCRSYRRVVIFCCGASAIRSVTRVGSIRKALSFQGRPLSFFTEIAKPSSKNPALQCNVEGSEVYVFFTYHPAVLLPGRKPALVGAVEDHFKLLERFLDGRFTPNSLRAYPLYGRVPSFLRGDPQRSPSVRTPRTPDLSKLPGLVCIDIETYGILKGSNQTVFHPLKSAHVDSVALGSQVITVSIAYRDPSSPSGNRVYVYDFDKHLPLIRGWFLALSKRSSGSQKVCIVGQNIKFDLLYLRFNDPVLASLLSPVNFRLDDTMLQSFLLYEQRPETGLKELATLNGITDFDRFQKGGSVCGMASSRTDPLLIEYNALDAVTALFLYHLTIERIAELYGKSSFKLSELCAKLRNAILWSCLELEATGLAMDYHGLRAYHQELSAKLKARVETAKSLYDLTLKGTGSDLSCRTFLRSLISSYSHDPVLANGLELTAKRSDIALTRNNIHFIANHFASQGYQDPRIEGLNLIDEYHQLNKLIHSYTSKLISHRNKSSLLQPTHRGPAVKLAYPTWYPIRSRIAKGAGTGSDQSGGTIQARFSCKDPPAQTFPPSIKRFLTSRFVYGRLISYDLSQIELRVAALLSGDRCMLDEYAHGVDRHAATALLVIPGCDPSSPTFRSRERALGKTLNFLVLYRGGPAKFQETAMRDLGIHLPLDDCYYAIESFDRRYHEFRSWQDSLIRQARTKGYLELPTGWSRTFAKGRACDAYINEICNFPVQTIAAQLMQSAQYAIMTLLQKCGLRARIVLQVHDSLFLDMPIEEQHRVEVVVDRQLRRPPLLSYLEDLLGRTVAIEYESSYADGPTLPHPRGAVVGHSPGGQQGEVSPALPSAPAAQRPGQPV